ncbi:hypothetical protein L1987_64262 [Smallanthus sonchifolius]|uniref:Uncharacterized protein n=1 Tax=Smallanthus sonchifolius TaxID=185202 RepID=A0ACB9CFZ9_9ASTR|nr:hypothetical protein L1987_64262 [Smallanthus sonchifolius]
MPWVGLYTAIASLICTLAMAADVTHGFWQWKLWFPNKFFTLNATTLTLIAISTKLPVDLTTNTSDLYTGGSIEYTKIISIIFLLTMLANFLPSLALMDDKELLTNIVALGILVITIIVNLFIQTFTQLHLVPFAAIPLLIFPILLPFSVALTISTTRKILEQRYKESLQLGSSHEEKMFSSKDLKCYVKKLWMMAETRNPQFVIACSPVSCAFGGICVYLAISSFPMAFYMEDFWHGTDIYKWSLKIIYFVQSSGVVVGSIAPMFRCFTSIGHYNLSKKWSKNHLNVFRVEKHWIRRLQQWKRSHVRLHIPGRHCKIVFHYSKNTFLNVCITCHVAVLVICKTICLIPRIFLILLSCCWHFIKSFLTKFKMVANESSEIEEYTRYVVQIEEEAKLSERILRNTLHSITQLLDEFEKKEPKNLIKLLEKSTGFNGVIEFDNDQVPPLYPQEINNCWSLVVVTLTATAMALPNIENSHFKGLLSSMREGLQIVTHIEECLNVDGDSIKVRKAARRVWTEVEVYRTWLQIDLQKMARKGKTSKEILQWIGDEAAKVVIQYISSKKTSIDRSPYKFILASSMYRISQTILLHYNERENWLNDEELFEWISGIIADVLLACFANLPHVIKLKCHHQAIEKRGDNIRIAAQLLGKSKKILKILKASDFPNLDEDSMAYIDRWWCALLKSQVPNNGHITNRGASSTRIQGDFSSSNELVIVTVCS